jgi:hypothetical protein
VTVEGSLFKRNNRGTFQQAFQQPFQPSIHRAFQRSSDPAFQRSSVPSFQRSDGTFGAIRTFGLFEVRADPSISPNGPREFNTEPIGQSDRCIPGTVLIHQSVRTVRSDTSYSLTVPSVIDRIEQYHPIEQHLQTLIRSVSPIGVSIRSVRPIGLNNLPK